MTTKLTFSLTTTKCLVLVISLLAGSGAWTWAPAQASAGKTIETGGAWTSFTTADGLGSDSILTVSRDANGYVWVGTTNGLSILSPTGDWLTLTSGDGLSDNIVTDIATDPTNPHYHWLATDGGVSLLDDGGQPQNKSVHHWYTFGMADGLANYHVSAVAVDRFSSQVWFGLTYLDDQGNEVGSGISVLDTGGTPTNKSDDIWFTYTHANSGLASDVIRDIAFDPEGTAWVATANGLNAFTADTWTVYATWDGANQLPSNDVKNVLVTGDLLWIATAGGVAALDYNNTAHDKTDDQWTVFTQSNSGLVSNNTRSLYMDGAGRLWISTDWLDTSNKTDAGAGVSVLDTNGTPTYLFDDVWTTFTTANRLADNAVRVVFAPGVGQAWLGTRAGLSRLDYGASPANKADDHWTTYSASARMPATSVSALADSTTPGIWLGTELGLSYLNYNATPHLKRDDIWTLYTTTDGLPANSIRALAIDLQGRLWIGTAAGLLVRDPHGTPANKADDTYILYNKTSGLLDDQVNDIAIDSAGRAWIACGSYFSGGLQVLDIGASLTSRYDDHWAVFTPADSGLPNAYARAVALDASGNVWVGTQGGAARLNYAGTPFTKKDDSWLVFAASASGLANDSVWDVAVDSAQNVWFALAGGGVSAYAPNGTWVTFTHTDGLTYDFARTILANRDGTIWVGTDGGGVSVLNYASTLANKTDDVWTSYPGTADQPGSITALSQDRWGQIWTGTFGNGVSVFSAVQFSQRYLPLARR